jgi:hypothetical protein
MSLRISIGCLVLLVLIGFTLAQDKSVATANVVKKSSLLADFQVIEFRRYTIRDGEREHFAQYFESYFPEAFHNWGLSRSDSFWNAGKIRDSRGYVVFTTWTIAPR